MPKFAATLSNAIALSYSDVGTLEHLFFQIPETGEYEFWVHQWDDEVNETQDYAVAWWAFALPSGVTVGDYDGSGTIDAGDYTEWKLAFGDEVSPGTGADGNGDGIIDAADYTVWRDHFGTVLPGAGSTANVPEPHVLALALIAATVCCGQRYRRVLPESR